MILVTGASGFLGTELINQLTAQQCRVRAIKRSTSNIPHLLAENPLIEWVIADLNEPESLSEAFTGVNKVYHCAALVSFNPTDKTRLLKVNIEGTSNVVNLCIENNARLIHVSSVAALGNARKGELITEKHFWEYDPNVHTYAISKYEGEMEVWRGVAEGLDALIVNPSVIIGKNAGFEGSGAIFKLIRDGLRFYTNGATGLVDVADVAKCMILLMDAPLSAERFILSAENMPYKTFFEEIAKGFNCRPPSIAARPWMLGIAWRVARLTSLFTGEVPALTRDTARSSFNCSYYSNQKIKDTLNIDFRPVSQSINDICLALSRK